MYATTRSEQRITHHQSIYARNFQPQDIPAERLTNVLYAFANAQAFGEVILSDTGVHSQKLHPGRPTTNYIVTFEYNKGEFLNKMDD
jgi:GH18 family chitinase